MGRALNVVALFRVRSREFVAIGDLIVDGTMLSIFDMQHFAKHSTREASARLADAGGVLASHLSRPALKNPEVQSALADLLSVCLVLQHCKENALSVPIPQELL